MRVYIPLLRASPIAPDPVECCLKVHYPGNYGFLKNTASILKSEKIYCFSPKIVYDCDSNTPTSRNFFLTSFGFGESKFFALPRGLYEPGT